MIIEVYEGAESDDSKSWRDWWIDTWCPILGAVPYIDGMTEADYAGQAAGIIHRLRADFFGQSTQIRAESVGGANRYIDPLADPAMPDPNRIAQARAIQREAPTIEKHALWALETWRTTRSGEPESLRLAGVANECRDGKQSASMAIFERALMTSVKSAFDFVLTHAEVHGSPPPFEQSTWPIHDVLGVLAIHAAADALQDLLADYGDQPMERRLRGLLNAQALDRMAREYKAGADAKAEPSRRAQKGAGKPRPNARSPLRRALEVLVARGQTTAQILIYLSDADAIAADHELPIEVCDPATSVVEDRYLNWYLRGGDSDNPQSTPIKTIQNLVSEIRNSNPA